MPRICWQTIFICGKPQWYGKPLKQRGLLSRQADIRRVTCASRVAGVRQAIRSGLEDSDGAGIPAGRDRAAI